MGENACLAPGHHYLGTHDAISTIDTKPSVAVTFQFLKIRVCTAASRETYFVRL